MANSRRRNHTREPSVIGESATLNRRLIDITIPAYRPVRLRTGKTLIADRPVTASYHVTKGWRNPALPRRRQP